VGRTPSAALMSAVVSLECERDGAAPRWAPSAWGPDDPALIRAGTFDPGPDNGAGQPTARAVRHGAHSWRFPILFFAAAIVWLVVLGSAGVVGAFWTCVDGISR